jgi:hypothetical protein
MPTPILQLSKLGIQLLDLFSILANDYVQACSYVAFI